MLQLNNGFSKGVLGTLLLFLQICGLIVPYDSFSQCENNLIVNGSLDGPVAASTNAEGWTSIGDPDLNSIDRVFGNLEWSEEPLPSQNGGTWQNISTIGEKLQQTIILIPGNRYFLEFEYASHGLLRNGVDSVFVKHTGVLVTIGNQILETAIDTTPYTWESTCLSFIAEEEQNRLTFEGSVTQGYLGIDGICLLEAEDQINIDNAGLCIGDELSIKVDGSSFSDIIWSDMTSESQIKITDAGEYWVDITDNCGTYREEFSITAEDCGCKLYIPNCFSPKLNDKDNAFVLGTSCELMDFKIIIFDRWGNIVHMSTDIGKSWQGEVNRSRVEAGQYLYKVTYNFLDEDRIEYGSVSVSY